jgi:AcrR family transcriptional regulator
VSARKRLEPDERRAQLMEAARRVFGSRPYPDVSVAEIAAEAGVSRALVNHYFDGKRGLLLAVLRDLTDRAEAEIRTDADLPVEEMVSASTDSWLDFASANREVTLAFSGIGAADPEVEELLDDLRDRIVDGVLESHLGTTDVPPAVRLALRAYTGIFQVAVRDWLASGAVTRDEVHTLLSRGLLATLHDLLPAR